MHGSQPVTRLARMIAVLTRLSACPSGGSVQSSLNRTSEIRPAADGLVYC